MIEFNLIDLSIIVVTFISAIIGLFRGMTKELITLITWILAGVLSFKYGAVVGAIFNSVTTDMIRQIIGGSLVFIGVLIAGGIFNVLISKFVTINGFIVLDKVLGAGFGVLRSVVILVFIVPLINDLFVNEIWWQSASLIPKLQAAAEYTKANLPNEWVDKYNDLASGIKPKTTQVNLPQQKQALPSITVAP